MEINIYEESFCDICDSKKKKPTKVVLFESMYYAIEIDQPCLEKALALIKEGE